MVPYITLDKTTAEIIVDKTKTLEVVATLHNATGNLTWTSSNTNVATTSGTGSTATITFKNDNTTLLNNGESETVIDITSSYGTEASATCAVIVKDIVPIIAVNTIATKHSTIDGEIYTDENPVIPRGFMAIDTDTSSWTDTTTYKNGLVISDSSSNEFVWIPVPTLSKMAYASGGTDANGRLNYRGMLYLWASDANGTITADWSTSSYREPDNLSTTYDNTTNLSTWNSTLYQESFNKMVESVDKYKGFYIGRYEMSLNSSTQNAQSKKGQTVTYSKTWFVLYEKAKTYSSSNTNLGVTSEMIWASQKDAMVWFLKENNITITSATPTDTARGVAASYNNSRTTGGANDLLNNIYDLLGCVREWTQEAHGTNKRTYYGGHLGAGSAFTTRIQYDPTVALGNNRYSFNYLCK